VAKPTQPPHGSSGDAERDMDARQDLLESSLAQVFNAYEASLADDVDEPVVLLLDCEDDIGGPMAREWEGDQAVDEAIRQFAKKQLVTTLARGFSFAECRQEIPAAFPYLAGSFDAPPEEGFLAIVVAAGGAGSFVVPFDAEE